MWSLDADALAEKLRAGNRRALIRAAYRIALAREPAPSELERNIAFVKRQTVYHKSQGAPDPNLAALTDLCDVILNLNEFVYIN